MRFITLLAPLPTFATLVLSAAVPTHDQHLVLIPDVDGMNAFIDVFSDACTLWPPFQNIAGLSLQTLNVVPGDFSGLNLDSEAIVICEWTDGVTTKPITSDVVAFVGATQIQ
ncbi:hypothetical protein B0H19DRAFT_1270375 [Mycena capillaripes]|nr:hypothetical protein B0H19DRAFT_1270375 [Mycena capillaripes]